MATAVGMVAAMATEVGMVAATGAGAEAAAAPGAEATPLLIVTVKETVFEARSDKDFPGSVG